MEHYRLPETVKKLIKLIGFESTHALIKHFGGIMLSIGKGVRGNGMAKYEAVAEVIGYPAMEILSKEFSGKHLSVPRCLQAFIDYRDAKIAEELGEKLNEIGKNNSAKLLTEKYNLTERSVYHIIAKKKFIAEENQFAGLCAGVFQLKKEKLTVALIRYARDKGRFCCDMIDIIGAEAFLELVKMFGGRTLAIPAMKKEEGLLVYEKIADAAGYEAASDLTKNYSGETVAIPKAYHALKLGRDIELLREFENMLDDGSATTAVEDLARKYQLTTRQVWNILKKPLPIH